MIPTPSIVEFTRDGRTISTDSARLDVPVIYDFLAHRSYWGKGRSFELVRRSIEHSLCFGMYDGTSAQIGFARVVTDYVTFAWLCDVFILESHRGQSLSKWLIQCIIAHPALKNIRRIMLATDDAHELYRRYGEFIPLQDSQKWMQRVLPYSEVR